MAIKKTLEIPNDAAKLLVKDLELEKYRRTSRLRNEIDDLTIDDVHRWFHFHVVRWLQDHGAELLD